jgi:type III restriction enzyme
MKFNFKIQQYQTDAVEAVARVFNGQPHYDKVPIFGIWASRRQISRFVLP